MSAYISAWSDLIQQIKSEMKSWVSLPPPLSPWQLLVLHSAATPESKATFWFL